MFFLHPCEIFPNKVYVPLAAFTMKMRWERPEKLMTASVPRMPGHASRTGSLTLLNLNCTFLLSNNTHSFQSHFKNIRADEFYEEQV